MKILFLSTWFPYPLSHGAKIRTHYLLRALAARHRVCLVSFADAPVIPAWGGHMREYCDRIEVVEHDPFAVNRLRQGLGWFSLKPSSTVASYCRDMAERVRAAVSSWQPDLIVASTFVTAPYALQCAGVPKVVDVDTLVSGLLREARDAEASLPRYARRWLSWWKFQRFERRLFRQFDLCLVASDRDRRDLAALVSEGGASLREPWVEQVPNGVDTSLNRPAEIAPVPQSLIFNGALSYAPNLDAMSYFVGDILPSIVSEVADVQLTVTGACDGDVQSRLRAKGHVHFTGHLDNVRQAVASSWVCVVPLRVGAGTRLKILEAMALGTPVVCTSKGCEGLDVTDGEHVLIADTAAAFADRTVQVLRDRELRQSLSVNARRLVEGRYGWTGIGNALCSLIERVVERRETRARPEVTP